MTVTCGNCRYFTPPLPIYEANSLGSCSLFEAWLDKFALRRPAPNEYDRAYAKLGGKVCYPLIERRCDKFLVERNFSDQDIK